MRKHILFFIAMFCQLMTFAVETEFHHVNLMFGISMRKVTSLCKDDNGFVYGASKMGVVRVTDGDYRIYSLPYTSSVISVRLVYANSQIYALSNNGQIFRYDRLYDRFEQFMDLHDYIDDKHLAVYKVITGPDHSLWLATSEGVYQIKGQNLTLVTEKNVRVWSLGLLDAHTLIYATNRTINTLNLQSMKSEIISQHSVDMEITALHIDSTYKKVWIGTTSQGLYYLDLNQPFPTSLSRLSEFPTQPILAIEENIDGTLLLGIDGNGIWEMRKEDNHILYVYKEEVNNPVSLKGNGVYDILCDENGRVWVATYSGGISFFEQKEQPVSHVSHQTGNSNSLGNDNVNKIIEDQKGNLWFGTDNGISKWDRKNNRWHHFLQSENNEIKVVLALCQDNDGNIWVGTYSSGVYILNSETGNIIRHLSSTKEFACQFVFDIFKDSQGDLWIGGTYSHVICYLAKEKKFRTYSKRPINSFFEIAPGKIVANCTYGLLLFNKEVGYVENMFDKGYIVQACAYVDNVFWIGTNGQGLLRYDPQNGDIRRFTQECGIPSNYINSIICSGNSLMLGTEGGLCRFSLSNNSVYAYPSLFSFSNLSYNANACHRLGNGEYVWGTSYGAVIFNPETFNEIKQHGEIYFQDMRIGGMSIREIPELLTHPVNDIDTLRLEYKQNTIALEFIPVDISSSQCKFIWKLEGMDKHWSNISQQQVVTYSNLSDGSHLLRVRMYDASLTQLLDERELHLYITPPYWRTWWFYLLLTVFVGGILALLFNLYVKHLKQLHSEDKIRFFTNMAHDIRTSLTLVKAPIEQLCQEKGLSESGNYYLNLATEQADRLTFVATQLLDIQKIDVGKGQLFLSRSDIVSLIHHRVQMFEALAIKNEIKLNFVSDKPSYYTGVDEIKIEKVVDNLLSNAIKYSLKGGCVNVSLSCDEKEWRLTVADQGIGISEKAQAKLFKEFYRGENLANSRMVGSGIGLLLVKNYVVMHQGTVSVKSKENVGTTFHIIIPYHIVDIVSSEKQETSHKIQDLSAYVETVTVSQAVDSDDDGDELPTQKKHLLVVEDNSDLQEFIRYSFNNQYTVSTANNGKEAWNFVQKSAPDLIISDVMMPEMDGLQFCKLLKSTFETSHIPIILLTSLSEKTGELEGLRLGADDYITKPFDVSLLKQRIESIIKNREIIKKRSLRLIGKGNNSEQPILLNDLNDQFIKKAIEVVREHISDSNFGKDEFAVEMSVSPSLLYKKLKALTEQSTVDFIKSIRMEYALELLQSRKHTITEISEYCGFSSATYFGVVFKKYFGKSPTDVLKEDNDL